MALECGLLTGKGSRREGDISLDILMYFAWFMSRAALKNFHDAERRAAFIFISLPKEKKKKNLFFLLRVRVRFS